jgi:MFS family permease
MLLWTAANLVSNAGTWMQMVAQNLLVLQLTGSVAMSGLSLSAQAAPALLFGFVGGAIADAFPRRLVAALGQVALAAVAFTTAGLAALDLLNVGMVMLLGVLSGVVATVDGPACTLLGNELVPREDVSSAIAVGSVTSNIGRLGGTALAGVTIAAGGIGAAYLANGLSFLLVAGCIPFLRSARRLEVAVEPVTPVEAGAPGESPGHDLRSGLRYLSRNGALQTLVAVGLITNLLGRNYTMSLSALVTGPLQASASSFAKVGTALAIGGIVGGVLAGRLHRDWAPCSCCRDHGSAAGGGRDEPGPAHGDADRRDDGRSRGRDGHHDPNHVADRAAGGCPWPRARRLAYCQRQLGAPGPAGARRVAAGAGRPGRARRRRGDHGAPAGGGAAAVAAPAPGRERRRRRAAPPPREGTAAGGRLSRVPPGRCGT